MRMTQAQIEPMIRFEDEAVLVVHKPPFLAVETKNPRQQDLVSLLKNRSAMHAAAPYVGLVHRLDQPVEGLLVLAKTPGAARTLSAGLAGGGFTKEYLAVVHGVMPETGTLVHTLKKDGRRNCSRVVCAGMPGGKEARLSYERLAVKDEKSLLLIRLDTGRHHQIRGQLAASGHPLCGDEKYGARAAEIKGSVRLVADGIQKIPPALCSFCLAFVHPKRGVRMEFCEKPAGAGFSLFSGEIESWIAEYRENNSNII